MSLALPKSRRLDSSKEFRTLYRVGSRWAYGALLFFVAPSSTARLGVTISKKWGKACVRNRFKRMVREGFRTSPRVMSMSYHINVHPRKGFDTLSLSGVQQAFDALSRRLYAPDSQPRPTASCRDHRRVAAHSGRGWHR